MDREEVGIVACVKRRGAMRQGNCSCLALYDWEGSLPSEAWITLAKRFFDSVSTEPDLLCIGGGKNHSIFRSWEDAKRKLAKAVNKRGEIINLFSTSENYKQLVFGWQIYAGLNSKQGKSMTLCCGEARGGFSTDVILSLLRELSANCRLTYGIGYQRSFALGPDLYAQGMTTGLGYSDDHMQKKRQISSWFHERLPSGPHRHLTGMLRDVYDYNILSKPHLVALVQGVTLETWLSQGGRGSLTPISENAWCWWVPKAAQEQVRSALSEANLLICRPKSP